jgi:hypothetical protein
MFKLFFIGLCNINNEITLDRIRGKKSTPRLNKLTVRIYHILFGTGR